LDDGRWPLGKKENGIGQKQPTKEQGVWRYGNLGHHLDAAFRIF
jgi:hypothetical protein